MFAKDMKVAVLLDFYGDLLSLRKKSVMDESFNADMSLGEIAEAEGISRQGVADLIRKATAELEFYEEKLGLVASFSSLSEALDELDAELAKEKTDKARLMQVSEKIRKLID